MAKSFGCSKCRYSRNGCQKCRNPDAQFQPKELTKEEEAKRNASLTSYELEREVGQPTATAGARHLPKVIVQTAVTPGFKSA